MRLWAVLATIVLIAACAAEEPEEPSETAAIEPVGFAVPQCEPDAQLPTAPEEWYRDRPRYVGNEQPIDDVRAWARNQAGFEEIWIDRDRNGWIGVGFSVDAEERQRDLEARFPDVGVVAVPVEWNLSELRSLQQEVVDVLVAAQVPFSAGVSIHQGAVAVELGVLTETNLALLEPFAGRPVCVTGRDPAGLVVGPQVEGGDGWRLLLIDSGARRRVGGAEPPTPAAPPPTPGGLVLGIRIEVATDPDQLQRMLELDRRSLDSGLTPDTAVPAVDFEREIVVLGAEVESGSCPELITAVERDRDEITIRRQVSDAEVGCTDDANSLTWLVALERASLPAPPFTVSGPATILIDADLRTPGATVADDRTVSRAGARRTPLAGLPGFDLDPRPESPPPPIAEATVDPSAVFPHVVETGFSSRLQIPVECLAVLGPINGFVWETAGGPPDDWLARPTGVLDAELLLVEDPGGEPTLDVTAAGRTIRFLISDRAPSC